MEYDVVIGIEIHCELKTVSKMFSGAPTSFGQKANTCVNEIDLGHPGAMPCVNKEAVKKANALRAEGHYVTRKDFSKDVNDRLKVYNATMRINRNEILKSKIGARLVELGVEQETDLTKKQIQTINELQEKIKLLKFDVSENLKIIFQLKETLRKRNQVIKRAREELSEMKKQNDYKNINYVLKILS